MKKLFYAIEAYIHMNISLKNCLCQCVHIPWNLIVSIGWKYMAYPVVSYPRYPRISLSITMAALQAGSAFATEVSFSFSIK